MIFLTFLLSESIIIRRIYNTYKIQMYTPEKSNLHNDDSNNIIDNNNNHNNEYQASDYII